MRDRSDLRWNGLALHLGNRAQPLLIVEPDARWPGMFRIRLREGRLSDMVNLSRAKDAATTIALIEVNKPKRGRSPAEAASRRVLGWQAPLPPYRPPPDHPCHPGRRSGGVRHRPVRRDGLNRPH